MTTIPTVVYALFLVVFTKDGPASIDKLFPDRFDCEVAETAMLTKARDDKDVVGWVVPTECAAIPETNKV